MHPHSHAGGLWGEGDPVLAAPKWLSMDSRVNQKPEAPDHRPPQEAPGPVHRAPQMGVQGSWLLCGCMWPWDLGWHP